MKIISSLIVSSALLVTTVSAKEGDIYAGIQASYPAYGASIKYDFSDKVAVQGVIGALGTIGSYNVRGIYRFMQKQDYWNIYGFGSVGVLTWGGTRYYSSETTLSIGGGAGVEWDWQKFLKEKFRFKFVPLYSSIEVGFSTGSFDYYDYNAGYIGAGIHYKF